MIPLYIKSAPAFKPPYITLALMLIIVAVFALTVLSPNFEKIVHQYGLVPERIISGLGITALLTSMFLHAGFLHLLGNIWFFWLFGKALEDNFGPIRYVIFFLIAGISAGLAHVFLSPASNQYIPAIGASGAISGILGGHLIVSPKSRVRVFLMIFYRPIFFYIPAYLYLPIWFLYQWLYIGDSTEVAFIAHIAGFIVGGGLSFFFKNDVAYVDYLPNKKPGLLSIKKQWGGDDL